MNIEKLVENVVVPTAVVSAIAYYLGWTASAAYYLSFGLSPSFIDKPIHEIVAFAWIEVALGIVGIALGAAIYQLFHGWLERISQPPDDTALIRLVTLFFALLILSLLGSVAYALLTTRLRAFVPAVRLQHVSLLALALLMFWLATVLGRWLQNVEWQERHPWAFHLFRISYPSPYIYSLILAVVMVFMLSRVAALRGLTTGLRDSTVPGQLPSVVVYGKEQLPLDGRYDQAAKSYIYGGYSFIDTNDDYLFILGRSATASQSELRTFVIPKDENVVFELSR